MKEPKKTLPKLQKHGEYTSQRSTIVNVPYCTLCYGDINGNGTVTFPYHCKCSEFEYDKETKKYDKRVKK